VRNLARVELAPPARFHVFAGDNGQGKTNLLETIFVVAALRSFRTTRLADLIGWGRDHARIRARVERAGTRRVYELVIEPHGRRVRLDDKAVRPLSAYFGAFNVVLFAPEDLALPRGTPAERRRFLDRAVFNRRASYLATAQDYEKVVRSRNKVLDQIADGRGGQDLLAVYDEQAAALGAELVVSRVAFLEELRGRFRAAFEAISRTGLEVDLGYDASVPELARVRTTAEAAAALRDALAASRARDLARRATSVGPHRDDLQFAFRARDAGAFASQGQLRALVLAWKTAELALLGEVHGELPILLLDDVSSELDETRNRYLFEHLAGLAGQCFITTTHPRHVLVTSERVDYAVRGGEILPVESAG
jgi:DNA replication and repair protein RecF